MHTRWKSWAKRGAALLGVLILLPHLYLLALRVLPVPVTLNMLLNPQLLERSWVKLDKIAPILPATVIGAEDSRFCAHRGIDWEATRAQLDAENGPTRGASTLSQQTAKNVFFWNGGGWVRKAGEAWFALAIDRVWGKRRVMEVYLNIAEWGDGLYGAEAAARARYGKPARDLSAREAAGLAAVLPNPDRWRLDPPGPYVRGRIRTLEARARTVRAEGLDACLDPE